jgi:hypothetical protein
MQNIKQKRDCKALQHETIHGNKQAEKESKE